ncbi:MAG: hypothetical protein PHS34_08270, partial [Candidatus Omnitrophica bacterium]|nr:hypothetical protein [Candidatus Omnitrophota bacterium]
MANSFLIGPITSGLKTDVKPWLLPEDAFERLQNAYLYEGRIRKRFGSTYTGTGGQLFSRLRIALEGGSGVGITDEFGNATAALPNKVPGNIFKVGQLFSIGTEIFTVNVVGTPAIMLTTGTPRITNTFNTDTGEYVFRGAAADTQIYFYPCEPVMGLTFFETNTLNNNPAIAFDTQFAYKFSGTAWDRVGPTSGSYFHGTNYNFFKATNWHGATGDVNMLFVSNFNATYTTPSANDDSMWRYDGTTLTGWTQFAPVVIVGANFVKTAKIILPFKDRLVLLNTIENNGGGGGGTNAAFPNRCRYSHNGSPFAANAFYEPNQVNSDGGGHQDAPTREEIVSAEFIKDRLIVYFEKSTWELASTSNQVKPFTWQKINAELGSESTFSSVPFDKAILTIGTTGVHACNG